MKKALISLLLATSVFGQKATLNVQDTTATDLNLYVQDKGSIQLEFVRGREPLSVSGPVTFWWATNGIRSDAVVEITNTITTATNVYALPYTAEKFSVESGRMGWTYGVEVDGKMIGDGRLFVKHRTGLTNALPTFLSRYKWDFTQISNYVGVAEYGPYLWGLGFAWTTNHLGQIEIISTAAEPSWENIQNIPDTFPPSTHGHAYGDITNPPALFTGSYTDLTDVPSVFPPDYHGYDLITNPPALFAPSNWQTDYLSDYSWLTNQLAGISPTGHVHVIGDVTGLQTALDGKAGTGTVAAIDGRVTVLETNAVLKTSADWTNTQALAAGALQQHQTLHEMITGGRGVAGETNGPFVDTFLDFTTSPALQSYSGLRFYSVGADGDFRIFNHNGFLNITDSSLYPLVTFHRTALNLAPDITLQAVSVTLSGETRTNWPDLQSASNAVHIVTLTATNLISWTNTSAQYLGNRTGAAAYSIGVEPSPVDLAERMITVYVDTTNDVTYMSNSLPHMLWGTATPTGRVATILFHTSPQSSNSTAWTVKNGK